MAMRPDAPEPTKARPDHSWSTRLAWLVLVAGVIVIGVRLSAATVVRIHGHGMAPTLLDGDHVLLVRGTWGLERGDVVVYDPTPISAPPPQIRARERKDDPRGHGIFFWHVRKAIEGEAQNDQGLVTWDRLSEYVRDSVDDAAVKWLSRPTGCRTRIIPPCTSARPISGHTTSNPGSYCSGTVNAP